MSLNRSSLSARSLIKRVFSSVGLVVLCSSISCAGRHWLFWLWLFSKLSLTLIYHCRYFPCTEQSLFDKSDVVRLSCRFFSINTFKNTPVGCNMMRQYGRRDHGSISTLMKKLTVTLIYRCQYFPCTEQSLFDQSDVFLTIMSLILHQHIRKHSSRM